MSKFLISLIFVVLFAAAALADPVLGTWKTEVDDGAYAQIDMHICGAKICGTIARSFNETGEYQSENLGRMIVIDMEPEGGGFYKGKVWRPSNDKIYIGKIELQGDVLRLAGCVLGGLICAKQTWSRLP